MKIIVIGGTGTIGSAVIKRLASRHEVISVGHSSGDFQVDITEIESIEKMYQSIGQFDGLISTTGKVHFGPLMEMKSAQYQQGLASKLMGQVNLVLAGLEYINDNGCFTLTSGILNRDPIVLGSSAAMVNGAIDGFVTSAAIEMPRGIRINSVSPTVIEESMPNYEAFFRGFKPVSAMEAAMAFEKSIEGKQTGKVYYVD
jgi:NAD(P)-dependent dehydrogenase (short-subunit alcohol dehydrogenase family)